MVAAKKEKKVKLCPCPCGCKLKQGIDQDNCEACNIDLHYTRIRE